MDNATNQNEGDQAAVDLLLRVRESFKKGNRYACADWPVGCQVLTRAAVHLGFEDKSPNRSKKTGRRS